MNRLLHAAAAVACAAATAASAQGYAFSTLDPVQPYYTIIPEGVNDAGTVTGVWTDSALVDHGFTAASGNFASFDAPLADTVKVIGLRGTWAAGIDSTGTVVGAYTAGGVQHGFVRSAGGATTTLDIAGHLNTALVGINDGGQMIGIYSDSYSVLDGVSFLLGAGSNVTTIAMPGSLRTSVNGLNGAGYIVGSFDDAAGHTHGFVRSSSGVYTTVDVAGAELTIASGINANGWIAGEYDVGGVGHGFVRDPLGQVTTLDAPGAVFTSGTAINSLGVVVGQFCDAGDICHGFVATPAVPEPASAVLMLAGLSTMLWRRRSEGARRRVSAHDASPTP